VNQSQRIVIGIVVFALAMVAWASFTSFNWWNPASTFFSQHRHYWGFSPFLLFFLFYYTMKRSCRSRDPEGDRDYPDRPGRAERDRG